MKKDKQKPDEVEEKNGPEVKNDPEVKANNGGSQANFENAEKQADPKQSANIDENMMKSGSTMMSTSNEMFSRQDCYKNLKSGISPHFTKAPPKNEMMDAILGKKRMDNEKAQLESRIVKLKKEEERAAKRIRDLARL